MNLEFLKKEIKKIDRVEEILKLFKTKIKNNVEKLNQDRQIDEFEYERNDEGQWEQGYYEEFSYKWDYIGSECLFKVYSEMGWSVEELNKNKKAQYSDDADCLYFDYTFDDIWMKIKNLDDFQFFAAMIIVSEIMNTGRNQVLGEYIKLPIKEFLNEHGLRDIIKEKSNSVFIAMSFGENMYDARKVIQNIVEKCGYNPIIIDMKEHNNQIVPEIFLEIKRSKFVIADLTEQKNGVYYEAGYAKALEKEIIYSCKSSDFQKIHFDIAQQNIINWENEEDLEVKLENRIEATIGKRY